MSTEANKALARRYNERVFIEADAVFDECVAPDCIIHGIGGSNDLKAILQTFHKAFPDLVATVDEMIAEGDKVVTRWTWRGAHTGELPSPYGVLAPTGKTITYTGITINRIVDNKIVEDRFEGDLLGLWQQLGAIPPPPNMDDPS